MPEEPLSSSGSGAEKAPARSSSRGDEVTLTQYRVALNRIEMAAVAMREEVDPDAAAEHWLPLLTREVAIVFAYVGDNMTARHVPRYHETVAALQAAKDRRDD